MKLLVKSSSRKIHIGVMVNSYRLSFTLLIVILKHQVNTNYQGPMCANSHVLKKKTGECAIRQLQTSGLYLHLVSLAKLCDVAG